MAAEFNWSTLLSASLSELSDELIMLDGNVLPTIVQMFVDDTDELSCEGGDSDKVN